MQCIHTNSGILGQKAACGCQDFYVNRGRKLISSDAHFFACVIFDWTLNPDNKCLSLKGNERLGIHSEKRCGVYNVEANTQAAPYCPVKKT